MKKIKYILLISFASLVVSCDNFLTQEPLSSMTKDEIFETLTEAESAVMGVYYDNADLWAKQYPYIANYSTDESFAEWTSTTGYFGNVTGHLASSTDEVYDTWCYLYKVIADANITIAQISKMSTSNKEQQEYLMAECKFLRALSYFDLLRLYGEVPLVTVDPSDDFAANYVGRSDEADILAQIIDDAEYAYERLSTSIALSGRASRWAAATLLAKVYMLKGGYFNDAATQEPDVNFANGNSSMTAANYKKAAEYLLDIYHNSAHELMTFESSKDYGELFLKSARSAVNREIIFDVQYDSAVTTSEWGKRSITGGSGTLYSDLGFVAGSMGGYVGSEFALTFSDVDMRFNWSVAPYSLSIDKVTGDTNYTALGVSKWSHSKFRYESSSKDQGVSIFRYADVVLMLAEVVNELKGTPNLTYICPTTALESPTAYSLINEVRRRVGLDDIDNSYLYEQNPASEYYGDLPIDSYGWLYARNIMSEDNGGCYKSRHVYYALANEARTEKELFFEALKMERAWELCFERHRWFDLKRWGIQIEHAAKSRAFTTGKLNIVDGVPQRSSLAGVTVSANARHDNLNDTYNYLPIPQAEMMANGDLNVQNYGY